MNRAPGIVERFFAWPAETGGSGRTPEATLASASAFLYAASVMLLTRRPLVAERHLTRFALVIVPVGISPRSCASRASLLTKALPRSAAVGETRI
jgi:hypothetical protein